MGGFFLSSDAPLKDKICEEESGKNKIDFLGEI